MDKTPHFGAREVPGGARARHVAGVFASVAPRYDLMNALMSAGMHRLWKRFTVETAGIRPGERVLDIAETRSAADRS